MRDDLTVIHRPKQFRWWVYPVPIVVSILAISTGVIELIIIVVLLSLLVPYYEWRTRKRGIWENADTVVVRNSDSTHEIAKNGATLVLRYGGEYGWIGWRAPHRPELDNVPTGPRLYLKPSPDEKAVRLEAALGMRPAEVYALAERIDGALGEVPPTH